MIPFEPPESFNVARYFLDDRVAEGLGERTAIHHDGGSLSYSGVQTLANRYGQVLKALGIRPEERVMIALPDGPHFPGALFGILKIGAVVVMANPGLDADAAAGLLEYTGCRTVILTPEALESFGAARSRVSRQPQLLLVGGGDGDHPSFDQLGPAADGPLEALDTHRDDAAIWLFSGGTTGLPKAVVQTHRSFANTTECYAKKALGYRPDDVTLSVPKLYFGYATGSNLLFPFSVGASTVLFPEHPTAEVVFERIRRHRPTILINVPTLINQMVSHPEAGEQDLSCLRFSTSAGEALPASLHRRWKELFGVELLDGLGTAEMWHIFLSNVPGDVRPGTLGRPVPGFEVKVCDQDGRELPPGEVGLLWVRGGSRALGYWRDLPRTAEAFRGEWFVGGDLVRRDEEGYFTYCGRGDDALKVGGKWLLPQEVESCLMRHPAVKECAVVGIANQDGLVKPCAFVVPASDGPAAAQLEEELKRHALESLEPYKHPRRVILLEDFPRTHLGKIDRGRLKTLA